MPDTDLPTDIASGKVVGRFIKTVADSSDPDVLPDEVVIPGTVKFTPRVSVYTNPNPNLAVVIPSSVIADINSEGYLTSSEGAEGVWLPAGPYKVNYRLIGARIRTHLIEVLPEHTEENPLNLTGSIPPIGPILTTNQYATLAARMDALAETAAVANDDPRLSDARTPLPHTHDDRYYTETEINDKLEDIPTTQDLANETEARQTATGEIWETLNEEVAARTAADAGFDTRIDLLEAVPAPDLSGYATDAELAAGLATKATTAQGAKADTAVQPADLSGYATDAELSSEASARAAADSALDSRVDVLEAASGPDLSGYATDAELAAEASTRASADSALDARMDVLEADPGPDLSGYATTSALTSGLATKATTAQGAKADTAVQPADLSPYATTSALTSGLATKAPTVHAHTTAQVTGLDTALAGKASTSHSHATSDVTGLDAALAGKADDADVTALDLRTDSLESRVDSLEEEEGGGGSAAVNIPQGPLVGGKVIWPNGPVANQTSQASGVYFWPFPAGRSFSFTDVALALSAGSVAGSTIGLAFYSQDPSTGAFTLLFDLGNVASDVTGVKTWSGGPWTVPLGAIWVAARWSGSLSVYTSSAQATVPFMWVPSATAVPTAGSIHVLSTAAVVAGTSAASTPSPTYDTSGSRNPNPPRLTFSGVVLL